MQIANQCYENPDDYANLEFDIGAVLAMAERMTENIKAIWDDPKFQNFYYCEFTHDDRYPAWAEQHEYHFK